MDEPVAKFWMVVRHDGGRCPVVKHPTRQAAEAEAERLVEKERSTFYVLEVVSKHFGNFVHVSTQAFAESGA